MGRDHSLLEYFHHVQAHLLALSKLVLPGLLQKDLIFPGWEDFSYLKPEKLHYFLSQLVKSVLDIVRKLGAQALHPWEVFLASLAPAAELEALVQLLLPLLQGEAEVVDPVVVRHLLPRLDRSLGYKQHLVTVDVQPQRVRLTAVVEQKQSWENCSSHLLVLRH